MRADTLEKLNYAQNLIDGGSTTVNAIKKARVGSPTYYKWKTAGFRGRDEDGVTDATIEASNESRSTGRRTTTMTMQDILESNLPANIQVAILRGDTMVIRMDAFNQSSI